MNWQVVEGKWDQIKGQVRQRWGKLTDDDISKMRGKRDQLVGRIKERYGMERSAAEREVDEFIASLH